MATLKAGHAATQSWRIENDNRFWDMHEKCDRELRCLSKEARAWLGKYKNRNGTAFLSLPIDQRTAVNTLLNRADKEFNGRLPIHHEGLAAEKHPCQKKEKKPNGKPYGLEMKGIVDADACTDNAKIINYWSALLLNYALFEKENHEPSADSGDKNEKLLAYGYACCNELARKGKMPLEIEILFSKINPGFDLVGMWKQKLEAVGRAFSETGEPPAYPDGQLHHSVYWCYVVSSLHARGALPTEAAWLSENFKLISELNKYLELAHAIGEQNINGNYCVIEATKWAAWRDEVRLMHSEHKLSPDIVWHFNSCSSILKG